MVGNVQEGTKPGGSPLPPTPSQQLQSPLCHPAVWIWWDVPWLVGFKPGKESVVIKSGGFLQLRGAWRLLFLRRMWGAWPEPAVALAPCAWRCVPPIRSESWKWALGSNVGLLHPPLLGTFPLAFLLHHCTGRGLTPQEHHCCRLSPACVPLHSAQVLVLPFGLGTPYLLQLFCSTSSLPSGPRPLLARTGQD